MRPSTSGPPWALGWLPGVFTHRREHLLSATLKPAGASYWNRRSLEGSGAAIKPLHLAHLAFRTATAQSASTDRLTGPPSEASPLGGWDAALCPRSLAPLATLCLCLPQLLCAQVGQAGRNGLIA